MDELPLAGTLGLECGPNFALFSVGKSAENPTLQTNLRLHGHELERAKKRMNSVLGENLEGLHREYQRSAPQSAQKCVPEKHAALLNSVLEENLEDQRFALHYQELECRRSAPYVAATRNRIRSSALPPACRSQEDVLRQDLGHFDNLLGIK